MAPHDLTSIFPEKYGSSWVALEKSVKWYRKEDLVRSGFSGLDVGGREVVSVVIDIQDCGEGENEKPVTW